MAAPSQAELYALQLALEKEGAYFGAWGQYAGSLVDLIADTGLDLAGRAGGMLLADAAGRDSITVRIEGLGQLRRDFRAIGGPALQRELRSVLLRAATIAAGQASAFAPRRTGQLAASIRPGARGTTAYVRSSLPYAGVQEFGGTIRPRGTPMHIRGRHFVGRAVDHQADTIVDAIGDGIDRLAVAHGFR